MKLAAMQSYWFPYLGYFDLINLVDVWVVYDASLFIRRGWMNRNRVLDPVAEWRYITVPVAKQPMGTPFNRVQVAAGSDWRREFFKALEPYRREAPFFGRVSALLQDWLTPVGERLAEMNTRLLLEVCRYLGIRTPFHRFSPEAFPGLVGRPAQELAIGLCRAFGADEYVNRPGGAHQFSETAFRSAGVRLTFQSFVSMTYACGRRAFIPDLSILDVLMWNPPQAIKAYLDTRRGKARDLVAPGGSL